jgi:hypothetical protein
VIEEACFKVWNTVKLEGHLSAMQYRALKKLYKLLPKGIRAFMSDEAVNVLAGSLEAIEKGDSTPLECLKRYPEHREELKDLLCLAVSIKGAHLPAIDPEFRSAARSRIIQAVSASKPRTLPETLLHIWNKYFSISLFRRPIFTLALVVALIFVLASVGTVYASGNALPGDSLYSVKTSVEEARLWFASDGQHAELYLLFAKERIREMEALAEKGRFGDIPLAAQRFEEQVSEATDHAPGGAEIGPIEVDEALSVHIEVLNGLLLRVPDQAKPALAHAIWVSDQARHKLSDYLPKDRPGRPIPTETSTITTVKPVSETPEPLEEPETPTGPPRDIPPVDLPTVVPPHVSPGPPGHVSPGPPGRVSPGPPIELPPVVPPPISPGPPIELPPVAPPPAYPGSPVPPYPEPPVDVYPGPPGA